MEYNENGVSRNNEMPDFPTAFRGYDTGAVKRYCDTMARRYSELNKVYNMLLKDRNKLAKDYDALYKQYEGVMNSAGQGQEQDQDAKEAAGEYQAQIDALNAQIADLQAQLAEQQTTYGAQQAGAGIKVDELRLENEGLRNRVAELEGMTSEELQKRVDDLTKELEEERSKKIDDITALSYVGSLGNQLISNAKQEAKSIVDKASGEAAGILARARGDALGILGDASEQYDHTMAQCKATVDRANQSMSSAWSNLNLYSNRIITAATKVAENMQALMGRSSGELKSVTDDEVPKVQKAFEMFQEVTVDAPMTAGELESLADAKKRVYGGSATSADPVEEQGEETETVEPASETVSETEQTQGAETETAQEPNPGISPVVATLFDDDATTVMPLVDDAPRRARHAAGLDDQQ